MSALLTDLYQLTMAEAYWRSGKARAEACFYLSFRELPFAGGYAIACGMQHVAHYIEDFRFTEADLAYLRGLPAADGTPLFSRDFLATLSQLRLSVDIDAVCEGTAVFPNEPLLRVIGPVSECQLVETALLNAVNYETLIATKAARIVGVAASPVAEFGLRRAQGPAGGVYASRAAIVGGCASTSNVEAGRLFDLPVSGTHAHSWVMAFSGELEAFRAYAAAFPHNCTLLVDTYDVLQGVKNAITVAQEMAERGQRLAAIRIDSGDLAWLSRRARALLDEAGLFGVKIIASNDLDEYTINSLLNEQDAAIDGWGVGTRLACAYDQPSLGGVYKMSALRDADSGSAWQPRLKISAQLRKSTLPGILQVRRYFNSNNIMVGDMIYDETDADADHRIIDPFDELRQKDLRDNRYQLLLQPLVRDGRPVADLPSAIDAQANTRANLAALDASNKRLLNPHSYPVGLSQPLHDTRDRLIRGLRGLE
ncbi:MAG: nicotinate phosphoribosyltransferase [Coriobacteriales bacterium]|nr:nicotinate phosphoribosyltransferase [Coriobacteriales bacterium]